MGPRCFRINPMLYDYFQNGVRSWIRLGAVLISQNDLREDLLNLHDEFEMVCQNYLMMVLTCPAPIRFRISKYFFCLHSCGAAMVLTSHALNGPSADQYPPQLLKVQDEIPWAQCWSFDFLFSSDLRFERFLRLRIIFFFGFILKDSEKTTTWPVGMFCHDLAGHS